MIDILVVDDQDLVRMDIKKMILEMQIDVNHIFEASDGFGALDIARKNKPDVILVDIVMPRLGGLDFISKVREENLESHVIIISAYNDFQYAQMAIKYKVDDYILKPVLKSELFSKLLAITNSIMKDKNILINNHELKNQYIYILLFEYLNGKDVFINIEEIFDGLCIGSNMSTFMVAVFNTSGMSQEQAINNKVFIDVLLKSEEYTFVSFCNGIDKIIYIFSFITSKIDILTNNIYNNIKNSNKFIQNCGISETRIGLHSLRELYRQADMALKESIFKDSNIYLFSQIKKCSSSLVEINMCAEILGLMNNGMKGELDKMLSRLFVKLTKELFSICDVEESFLNLIDYLYINTVEEYPGIYDINTARNMIRNSNKTFNIKVSVKSIIDSMYNFMQQYKIKDSDNNDIDYILKYVKHNYNKCINLAQVSNELSMNYSYISNLFSLKVGKTFTQYIVQVRMEKAKNMLISTNNKINDIAENCGYSNSKYFYRVFKGYVGITPNEYRDKYTKF